MDVDAPSVGQVLRLKRAHVCGSDRFAVTLVGLDIRLSCAGCGARLILTRAKLQSRLLAVEGFLQGPPELPAPGGR